MFQSTKPEYNLPLLFDQKYMTSFFSNRDAGKSYIHETKISNSSNIKIIQKEKSIFSNKNNFKSEKNIDDLNFKLC